MEPNYQHDCDNCQLIGVLGPFDLYYCETQTPSGNLTTYIVRYGDEGPEYESTNPNDWPPDMSKPGVGLLTGPTTMMLRVAVMAHKAIQGHEILEEQASAS